VCVVFETKVRISLILAVTVNVVHGCIRVLSLREYITNITAVRAQSTLGEQDIFAQEYAGM